MAGIKAAVIGMGVLLVIGFVVVAATLVQRMSGADAPAPTSRTIDLAPGEALARVELDGGRVLFHIETTDGARVEVRDLASGALRARFDVAKAGKAIPSVK